MCGVFGYVGSQRSDLSSFLLDGLSKLEYRGYDSSGIAVFSGKQPKIFKEVGEIKNLKKLLNGRKIAGSLGIGHTRWATHGEVNRENAHPHTDCTGNIVVVHNGIIENFSQLKNKLSKRGHKFISQTDTEVFAHLIEEKVKSKRSFSEAVRLSFNKLKGLNAVVAVCDGEIVAFRRGSPLVAGVGNDANFISSDIPALSSQTEKIVLIEDGYGVKIIRRGVFLIDGKSGKIGRPKIETIRMSEVKAWKAGFAHFLLKEIHEQPEVITRIADTSYADIRNAVDLIKNALGTYFTACGSASYAGLAATYMFSSIAKRHVNFALASEFPYFENFLVPRSLLIAASQSGETMDTLEAVRAAKRRGSKVLAVVNVPGSSLVRLADYTIYLKAGTERAVLSTKAYTAKLAFFLLFAYALAGKYQRGVTVVKSVGRQLSEMFKNKIDKKVKTLAQKLKSSQSIYLIGRGVNYPTALEGALKIKEDSYIHAEGFAAGELKHGVIALVEKGTPCIATVANDEAREATVSNAIELKSRGAYVIGISPQKEPVFDFWIEVADAGEASPIVNVVPLQLLAYHLAIFRGYNPDMPRNLAKSVTVK